MLYIFKTKIIVLVQHYQSLQHDCNFLHNTTRLRSMKYRSCIFNNLSSQFYKLRTKNKIKLLAWLKIGAILSY